MIKTCCFKGKYKFRAQNQYNNSECEKKLNIRRGDIFYADLSQSLVLSKAGVRPVLIVQNDVGNRF